jgi:DegV family protein with EDD domain
LAPPETDAEPEAAGAKVHVVTDAAGSMTRQEARRLNMTLLDSYIIVDDRSCPETLMAPEALYGAMRAGRRVSTAQASAHEKHEAFRSILGRFPHSLYLCVGSVYTGNYAAARHWCQSHDPQARLQVLDSTAASGRLGLMARIVGRHARGGADVAQVVKQALLTIDYCDELVFLDQLKYLAAGGRISKSKGFFGDLLGLKPVIRPGARGVQKLGVVRRRPEQLPFALDYLQRKMADGSDALILLQYTDNEERVRTEILPAVAARFPAVEMMVRPLSLTSGVHMGPGTWALAFHPTKLKVE